MSDTGSIGTAISGVASLISTYMTYRVGTTTVQQGAKPNDETLEKGESAVNIVRTGVSQYGTADEKAELANFERNPQQHQGNLAQVLTDIAQRYPVFRQELESFVQQNDVLPGDMHR